MDRDLKNINTVDAHYNENAVFYQKVDIHTTAKAKDYSVRLDENYLYCQGVMLVNTSLSNSYSVTKNIFGIKQFGKNILNHIPMSLIDSTKVHSLKDKFFKLNTIAKGNQISLYIENGGVDTGNFQFVFLLTNKKSDFIVPKYDYNFFEISGNNTISGNLFFKYKKNIEGVCFINSSDRIFYSISNSSKTFIDRINSRILNINNEELLNDRFIKLFLNSDNLKYIIENQGPATFLFIIFKYN